MFFCCRLFLSGRRHSRGRDTFVGQCLNVCVCVYVCSVRQLVPSVVTNYAKVEQCNNAAIIIPIFLLILSKFFPIFLLTSIHSLDTLHTQRTKAAVCFQLILIHFGIFKREHRARAPTTACSKIWKYNKGVTSTRCIIIATMTRAHGVEYSISFSFSFIH